MQRILALSIAAISLGLAGLHPVDAADMALVPLKAPVPVAPPYSWTGFYIGGNVGAGIGTTETSVNVGSALTALTGTPISLTARLMSETLNGFLGGGQVVTTGRSACSWLA